MIARTAGWSFLAGVVVGVVVLGLFMGARADRALAAYNADRAGFEDSLEARAEQITDLNAQIDSIEIRRDVDALQAVAHVDTARSAGDSADATLAALAAAYPVIAQELAGVRSQLARARTGWELAVADLTRANLRADSALALADSLQAAYARSLADYKARLAAAEAGWRAEAAGRWPRWADWAVRGVAVVLVAREGVRLIGSNPSQ